MSDEHHMNLLSSWDEDSHVVRSPSNRDAELRIAFERIAELEATVTRLTAPVTEEEAVAVNIAAPWYGRVRVAMDAFLERRMKG